MTDSPPRRKPGPRARKITRGKFLEALKNSAGNLSLIGERLDLARQNIHRFIQDHPEVQQAYEDEKERVGDMCENKLISAMQAGDTKILMFYARTKLRGRGYVERQEIEHKGAVPTRLIFDDIKPDNNQENNQTKDGLG